MSTSGIRDPFDPVPADRRTPVTVHIDQVRRAAAQMRDATTTRTGLVLPRPVAETLTGWLDQVAAAEQDYYASNRPDQVGPPEPGDAAHGAWTIAQAWLTATGTEPAPGPAHRDRRGAVTTR